MTDEPGRPLDDEMRWAVVGIVSCGVVAVVTGLLIWALVSRRKG